MSRSEWVSKFAASVETARRFARRIEGPGEIPPDIAREFTAPVKAVGEGALQVLPSYSSWGAGVDIGGSLHYYRSLSSTNVRLKELSEEGAAAGSVVVAEEQTAGKGRHGRWWYSPPGGGLYASILLRPRVPSERAGWITLSAALAMVRVAKRFGAVLEIKWPNDVEHEGRKVAGVLVEVSSESGQVRDVILGTGVNVAWDWRSVPEEIAARGTTLNLSAATDVNRDVLLAEYVWEVHGLINGLEAGGEGGSPQFASEVMARMGHLGENVRVRSGDRVFSGICTGLSEEGFLQLDSGRELVAGELIA